MKGRHWPETTAGTPQRALLSYLSPKMSRQGAGGRALGRFFNPKYQARASLQAANRMAVKRPPAAVTEGVDQFYDVVIGLFSA
jgi:hypothetical protein